MKKQSMKQMTMASFEPIEAKSLLTTIKKGADQWFGLRYNMNLYRGCQHGCIYCDSRSTCYQMRPLEELYAKTNAIPLLDQTLKAKREVGTIGFGSMNDPYMPIEARLKLTRSALEVCLKHGFPVHIITKSTLVTRDIDLLSAIGNTYSAVSFTITTADDTLCKKLEPHAPTSSQRYKALKLLSEAGIYCGITLMPILPFLNDTKDNIETLVRLASESGAKYIIPSLSVTLREGSRDYFYKALDQDFKGLRHQYERHFATSYQVRPLKEKELIESLKAACKSYQIPLKMTFYTPQRQQLNLFDDGFF